MTNQRDAIVIGAGLGGLAAAARLARAGKNVLVLEQHSGPGGYAHGTRRGDFYFDFSLHSMDGIAPGGWAYLTLNTLGVLDRVTFERLDPYYGACYPNRTIVAPANPFAYEAELIRHFPHEANGLRTLFDEMGAIYRDAHRGRVDHALERYPSPDEMLQLHPAIIRGVRESWAELMARHLRDPELKAVVSAQWFYGGLPPSRLNAAAVALQWVSAHHYGAFYPHGGSAAINCALEAIIREGGGEIMYNQAVTRLHIEDGHAVGVCTEQGLEARARVFVANANAPDTLLKLVGREHLPAGYASRVEVTPASLSTFNIFLGLDGDLPAQAGLPHQLVVAESYDLEAQYAAIEAGDWQHTPYVLVNAAAANSAAAPAGKSTLTLMCLAPWNYQQVWGTGGDLSAYDANPSYRRIKEAVADTLLARAEQHLPGLRAAIVHKEIATPLTNARYTRNPGGAIYGYEQSSESMYLCRLNEETPIPNLFLAGAWTLPGGGQSAALLSGYDGGGHALLFLDHKPREVAFFATVEEPSNGAAKAAAHTNGMPNGALPPFFPAGQPAPDFTLTAVHTARQVGPQSFARRPVVLVFVSQSTTGAIGEVNDAVRAQFPLASQVVVASVFDFGSVPGMFHKLIGLVLNRAYSQAVAGIPAGLDPDDYVLILPDWSGKVCTQFNVRDTNKAAAVVVIDRAGTVQGALQGSDLAGETVRLLRWL